MPLGQSEANTRLCAFHQRFQSSADYKTEWEYFEAALGLTHLDYVQVNNRQINRVGQIKNFNALPTRTVYDSASPFTLEIDEDSDREESTETEAPHSLTASQDEVQADHKESLAASSDIV